METLYQQYKEEAQFYMIYIREAHPADGWQVPVNIEEGWVLNDPVTWEERKNVAEEFITKMNISIPVLIDSMDNKTDSNYVAWPDRVYIVGKDGKIAYKGGKGPWGFEPMEITDFFGASTVRQTGKIVATWAEVKVSN